jgi:hypothetical protein
VPRTLQACTLASVGTAGTAFGPVTSCAQPTLTKSSQPLTFTDFTFPETLTRIGSSAFAFFQFRRDDSAFSSECVVIWQYSNNPSYTPAD